MSLTIKPILTPPLSGKRATAERGGLRSNRTRLTPQQSLTSFSPVYFGSKNPKPKTIRFEKILDRWGTPYQPDLDEWIKAGDTDPRNEVALLEDPSNHGRLTVIQNPQGKRLFWFDFQKLNPPVMAKMSKRLAFSPFQEKTEAGQISFEDPAIHPNSLQFTAYCVQPAGEGSNLLKLQPMHFYLGEDYLVTTHEPNIRSLQEMGQELVKAGIYKPPAELAFIFLEEVIRQNGKWINPIQTETNLLFERITNPQADKPVPEAIRNLMHRIGLLDEGNIKQMMVLQELEKENQIYHSRFILPGEYERLMNKLIVQRQILMDAQNRLTGLINTHLAMSANELNRTTGLLTKVTAWAAIPTLTVGAYGMNVALPGAANPDIFAFLVLGSCLVSAAINLGFARWRKRS